MKTLVAFATVVLIATATAAPVLGADNQTVDATVEMAAPCLTVSTTSIDFGTLLFSRVGGPWGSAKPISYTDCSGFGEQIYGRATNASETGGGSGAWDLVDAQIVCPDVGLNKYRLEAQDSDGATWRAVALLTTDRLLEYIGQDAVGAIDRLGVTAPCSGSDGSGATMSLQITFTASF